MVPFEAKTRQMYHYKLSHCDYSGWGWVSKIVGGLSKLGRGVVKLWGQQPLRKYGTFFNNSTEEFPRNI